MCNSLGQSWSRIVYHCLRADCFPPFHSVPLGRQSPRSSVYACVFRWLTSSGSVSVWVIKFLIFNFLSRSLSFGLPLPSLNAMASKPSQVWLYPGCCYSLWSDAQTFSRVWAVGDAVMPKRKKRERERERAVCLLSFTDVFVWITSRFAS